LTSAKHRRNFVENKQQMKNEEKSTVTEVAPALEIEKKREIISIQVTPEEKRTITRMAVKDCGISISEFVRTKIFVEPKTVIINNENESPLTDEERTIYDEKISELNLAYKKLLDENIKLKVSKADPNIKEVEQIVVPTKENVLAIELEPKTKEFFDNIKNFRDLALGELDEKEKEEFEPFEKFVKVLLLRGLKRSYYGSCLNSSTGLTTADIREMSEAENIDYEAQV
jgi:hypothetical protein